MTLCPLLLLRVVRVPVKKCVFPFLYTIHVLETGRILTIVSASQPFQMLLLPFKPNMPRKYVMLHNVLQ